MTISEFRLSIAAAFAANNSTIDGAKEAIHDVLMEYLTLNEQREARAIYEEYKALAEAIVEE